MTTQFRALLAVEQQHEVELQQCEKELLVAQVRAATLKDEPASINSPAGILMKQKQQAEAALEVGHPPAVLWHFIKSKRHPYIQGD